MRIKPAFVPLTAVYRSPSRKDKRAAKRSFTLSLSLARSPLPSVSAPDLLRFSRFLLLSAPPIFTSAMAAMKLGDVIIEGKTKVRCCRGTIPFLSFLLLYFLLLPRRAREETL